VYRYIRHKYIEEYTTSEEPNKEGIAISILNASEDENNQTDDETEEILYESPSILEVYFSADQVRNFVSLNNDINTPEIPMVLKNIANFVKKSYCSSYGQSTITDFFSN